VRPEAAKPVPFILIWLIVVLALPVLVRVIVLVTVEFTAMLPKFKLEGLALRSPCGIGIPVPVSGTVSEEFAALLLIVKLPLYAIADEGEKVICKVTLAPLASM
jgi:hypothetical protein